MTIALDTNVLLRVLIDWDDPKQTERARALFDGEATCTAPVTVFLELAWTLKHYGLDKQKTIEALKGLLDMQNFESDAYANLMQALDWAEEGMDIADAIHLALSSESKQFKTFDKNFIKAAKREGAHPAVSLLK